MASASSFCCPNPNPISRENGVVSYSKRLFSSSRSLFLGSKLVSTKTTRLRNRPESVSLSGWHPISASCCESFDVVIIGAGIIGLTIARQLLIGSELSVAVVEKAVPCSGATGAGQGYIWMVPKTPGSEKWELAMRSHKLWQMLAQSVRDQGLDPLQVLGWKKTGSLLVGRTPEELDMLKRRVKKLSEAGLRAECLCSSDLLLEEPELMVGDDSGAAFLPDDFQLDAQCTAAFIEKANRHFALKGRYAEFYNDPVTCLLRSGSSSEVVGVQTSKNTLYSKAIVVAAGSWSGSLMHDLLRDSDILLDVPVKPRKGHLLVLENFKPLQLNHGLMEVGYVDHQTPTQLSTTSASEPYDHGQALSVSMTATLDAMGNLVLGSSRQFVGFSSEVDESIINHIWKRAGEFFPKLQDWPLSCLSKSRKVRIGLRPYMFDGKPVIGSVPGMSNVFLATGHEGEGLSLALGTAEIVADMVLGNPGTIDHAPFAVQGRCC
uniref:FAD-dependent oxidoreductase domain-containing protein 1 n=1 Tax=Fagus sylvatica TaxID=28930 RepID=A0A2N9I074_FAGSY